MKICAVTMVYRDHWALSEWFRYFSRQLGAENLFVVAHGADPDIARICPGASIVTIPRDDLSSFDRNRGKLLNAFQTALSQAYDWVIRTDADELLVTDPNHHNTLAAAFGGQTAPALFALGMNAFEFDDAPPLTDRPVLETRPDVVFSGHYSKAVATQGTVGFWLHGVRVLPRKASEFPFVMPRGLYLVHLKHANLEALARSNRHRKEIARSGLVGVPGKAWYKADRMAARAIVEAEDLPLKPWEEAEEEAYQTLGSDPKRDPKTGLVRARFLDMPCRTRLPDRMRLLP